jgi:hypothetical protein
MVLVSFQFLVLKDLNVQIGFRNWHPEPQKGNVSEYRILAGFHIMSAIDEDIFPPPALKPKGG